MTDSEQQAAPRTTGPALSFGFNLQKIAEHGEDSEPLLRDGPDLGLAGVFDGMGGAGGTVYETPDGPRSGAYLASRIARDAVEDRMVQLLEPDWNLRGDVAAEELTRTVRTALQGAFEALKAPTSRLRSKLLRALPTTMAVVALQRAHRGDGAWTAHVFWAGDSRAYVLDASGLHQLSTDDLREPVDAMENLRSDSVISNALSADTEFHVNYRRVELQAPFLVIGATDGCFGYLPTPMHFEDVLLTPLATATHVEAWSAGVQQRIAEVTGDDASMAVLGVGGDLAGFQALLAARTAEVRIVFAEPLDVLAEQVRSAEAELAGARLRQQQGTTALWAQYREAYEHHLHAPQPTWEERPVWNAPATERRTRLRLRGESDEEAGVPADAHDETADPATGVPASSGADR